jgi:hypothetical protein
MKNVVLYEGILAKFISYFLELYLIWYGLSNFGKGQVQNRKILCSLVLLAAVCCSLLAGRGRGRGRVDGAAVDSPPGSSSGGLGTTKGMMSSGSWPARTRSSGSVRWVAVARLDSHGGEARSEEWLTEELEVAMAERWLWRASRGGRRSEHGRGSSEARRRGRGSWASFVGSAWWRVASWERRRPMRRWFLFAEADEVALIGTPVRGGDQACELEGGRRSQCRAKAQHVSGAWSGGLRCGHDRRPRRWVGEAHGHREELQQQGRQGHGRGGRCARVALPGKTSRGWGVRWKEKKEREGEAAGWDRLHSEGTNWQAGLAEKNKHIRFKIKIQNWFKLDSLQNWSSRARKISNKIWIRRIWRKEQLYT